MTQVPRIDAEKLKSILDLKDLENRFESTDPYSFIEPERDGFTYIQLPTPVQPIKRESSINMYRCQTPLETKRKRRSVMQRNYVQTLIMKEQKKFVDVEREAVQAEIDEHEAILTEELFHLVIERNKSVDPVDMELVAEIKQIPQVNFAMKRMNEKKWLDIQVGVTNPQKVGTILKGFEDLYKAEKERKETNGAVDKTAENLKKFERNYNSQNHQPCAGSENQKAAPKVQLLPHQERLRRRNAELRKENELAFNADAEQAPRSYQDVKNMISRLNNIALVKQDTIAKDIWNR